MQVVTAVAASWTDCLDPDAGSIEHAVHSPIRPQMPSCGAEPPGPRSFVSLQAARGRRRLGDLDGEIEGAQTVQARDTRSAAVPDGGDERVELAPQGLLALD